MTALQTRRRSRRVGRSRTRLVTSERLHRVKPRRVARRSIAEDDADQGRAEDGRADGFQRQNQFPTGREKIGYDASHPTKA